MGGGAPSPVPKGESEEGWRAASLLHRLDWNGSLPGKGGCPTRRKDDPYGQRRRDAARSHGVGGRAEVLLLAMTPRAINQALALHGDYTEQVLHGPF